MSLLLIPAANAQRRHLSLALEDSYRDALADFAAGSPDQAVSRVVELEEGSSPECIRAIELRTAEELARREPESLVVQAYLRLAVRQARYQTRSRALYLFGFESDSITGLRELVDLYVATSRQGDARSVAAGLVTSMADGVAALRSAQRLEAARVLLEGALKLDRDHVAALHSLAVTLELLGRPGQSLPYLDRLLALAPEDPRFRLRRAVVTVKSGRLERGQLLLEQVTTIGPIWARDLATQELARLLVAGGREDEAAALLREGLRELPGEKLSLQLAAMLDPRWTESWEVLDAWFAEPLGDSGPSARLIYEDGAKDDLDALKQELGSKVLERLAGLESALRRLPELAGSDRLAFADCR